MSAQPIPEVPRETQRFILALVSVVGFLAVFSYVFYVTRDVEMARTVLTVLSGAVSSIIAFFFGVKTAEKVRSE
jgi:hypothetical protein